MKAYQSGIFNNYVCRECSCKARILPPLKTMTRNCPECKKEIIYENKYSFLKAEKENKKCQSCATTKFKNEVSKTSTTPKSEKKASIKTKALSSIKSDNLKNMLDNL